MLIFQDADKEKEILIEPSSIVAIEEAHHGKNSVLYLQGGHKFHVTASVSSVRETMKAATNAKRDFEVSEEL